MSGNDNDDTTGKTRSESDDIADNELLKIHLDLMDYLIAAINTFTEKKDSGISMPLLFDDNDDTTTADTEKAAHQLKMERLGEIIYYIDLITRTSSNIHKSDIVPAELLSKLDELHMPIKNNAMKLVKVPFASFNPKYEAVMRFNTRQVIEEFVKVYNSIRPASTYPDPEPDHNTKRRKT